MMIYRCTGKKLKIKKVFEKLISKYRLRITPLKELNVGKITYVVVFSLI